MTLHVGVHVAVKAVQVRQNQAKRAVGEEGGARVLEGRRRDEDLPAAGPLVPAQLAPLELDQSPLGRSFPPSSASNTGRIASKGLR